MPDDVKRLNYFNGQFLREADFTAEQTYHLELQRDIARLLHVPGVAEGLEVPDPAAGASAITVQAGVAYDDLGRRMRLANNLQLELAGFAADADVYVTITYAEEPTDVSDETGTSGSTRVTEAPDVEASTTAPGNPNRSLVLARVVRAGTVITSIDRAPRLRAGARGGDLTVSSLRLSSDSIDPGLWPVMKLEIPSTVDVTGNLDVSGNIKVDGTVEGRDIAADGAALDTHRTATNNPHATTAAQIDTQGGANQLVARINAGTGVINEPRIDAAIARQSALAAHTGAASNAHAATAISAAAHNNISAGNVQSQLQEIVTDLASQAGPGTGASLVGNDAMGTAPNNVAAGNLRAQLTSLLNLLAGHVNNATGAHAASAISVADAGNNLNGVNVETALAEIADALEGDHFRGNEGASAGQHRTIRQPVLGGSKALILDSNASGDTATRLRIYSDNTSVWFTVNAWWNGTAWARDSTGLNSGGMRFSRFDIEFFNEPPGSTFTEFANRFRLPLNGGVNSGFETVGSIQETGQLVLLWSNAETSAARTLYGTQTVNFRSRFPAPPSSITFSLSTGAYNIGAGINPTVWGATTRDGFACYIYHSIPASGYAYWFGTYTAIA